jgi:organic radical activating enzyme
MHYHGPIVRPQTDADSIFVEVTVGCTHNNCTFCNFYDGYPFRVAPLSQVEADLQEAAANFPHAKKVWASGGNPFALSVNKLATLAKLFKKYLPEAIISTYARVDDITSKSVDDLKTMNMTEEHVKQFGMREKFAVHEGFASKILQAETKTLYAYNTTQFTDYDKYESSIFDPQAKAAYREEMFPKQCAAAYELGKNLLV